VAFFVVLAAPPASAQGAAEERDRLGSLRESLRIAAATAAAQAPSAAPRRDSLLNGAAIGAVAGGVALGVVGGVICTVLHEEGNPPCWRGTLAIGAIGAGIGAAAGAGIDAMISSTTMTPPEFGSGPREGRALVINWRQRF
jgi:MFS family permease